jgi:hypothetical protein
MKTLTLSERIDQLIAAAPRSRPWYDTANRCWRPGHLYLTRKAVFAVFMAHRRQRAMEAMAALDAEIAREEAAEKRRRPRRKKAPAGQRRTTR